MSDLEIAPPAVQKAMAAAVGEAPGQELCSSLNLRLGGAKKTGATISWQLLSNSFNFPFLTLP